MPRRRRGLKQGRLAEYPECMECSCRHSMLLLVCLLLVCLLSSHAAPAAVYYVDAAGGNDANTGVSAASAWKTLDRVNAGKFKSGDEVLFKRGQVFYGSLRPSASGVSYAAYGTGDKPVISGISVLTGWIADGNGIYETGCPSCPASVTMLSIDDTMRAMGRYPNAGAANGGYLTIGSHTGNTAITDSSLSPYPDWTGAEIVIKKNSWTLDRGLISGQSGHMLTYASVYGGGFDSQDGYGYFLQNSPLTLDVYGEWYYNPAAKKIMVFFGRDPAAYSVKTATIDTLVWLDGYNDLFFTGLSFEGSAAITFGIQNAGNVRLLDCDIAWSGNDAIRDSNSAGLVISGCTINHTNNTAIEAYGCDNGDISGNRIGNTGMLPGMGGRNGQPYKGIAVFGTGNRISRNSIDSTGYMGIFFYGDSTRVSGNYVDYFGTVLDDGGGIYTYGGPTTGGRVISDNIILNGIGSPAGTTSAAGAACGIYADDRSTHVEIDSNTAAFCVRAGIYLHNAHETGLRGNTLFGNGQQLLLVHDAAYPADSLRNLVIKGNIFFSGLAGQFVSYCSSLTNDIERMGEFDSNAYARPFDTAGIIAATWPGSGEPGGGAGSSGAAVIVYKYYDLNGWSTAYRADIHSRPGPHLVPYTIQSETGPNIFANGSFSANTNGAFCLSSPGPCSVSWSSGGHLDGGAVQVSYQESGGPNASSGGPNASLGVYFNLGAVQAGRDYIIRFSLQGNNTINNTFQLFLLRSSQPAANHSPAEYYSLTPPEDGKSVPVSFIRK